jgi:hypothetical protein
MKQILLSAVIVFSLTAIISPVYAVGPYFENESPGRGQFSGPNPIWPRPDEPLWSPSRPRVQPGESWKKGETGLKYQKEPDKAQTAAQDIIEMPTDKNTARR